MNVTNLGGLPVQIVGDASASGPVVVLLHGFGAAGNDLVPLGRVLTATPGTRFVFPEAPIALGREYGSGRAWWVIDMEERMRRLALGQHDIDRVPNGLDEARAKVDALLDDVERTLRPPPGKLVLGGFSQGAMLSLDVTLRSSRRLAGLVLMSGTHIAANEWATRFEARRGLPVFMSHGEGDDLLPYSVSEGLRDTLISHGMPVDWVPFRGGHGIPPNVVYGVSGFLARVLA
jgi:phospholipase/carboxylesterase